MNWHYMDGDKQIGPLTVEEIGTLIEADKLTEDTLVWNETLSDWTRLIDSGLVEAEEITSPTIEQQKHSPKSCLLGSPARKTSSQKVKFLFIAASVALSLVLALIAILINRGNHFTGAITRETVQTSGSATTGSVCAIEINTPALLISASNRSHSSGSPQRTELKQEASLDDEGERFNSPATSLRGDAAIPSGSRLDVIFKVLNGTARGNEGIFAAPFGFESTPGLPAGFKDSRWGDSLDKIRERLGSDVKEVDKDVYKILQVTEKIRKISYYIDGKTGLYRVHVEYIPSKEEEVIAALVKQFGKVPEENIVAADEVLLFGGERNNTEIHWLDDNTHIKFQSQLVSSTRRDLLPIATLSIWFEPRNELNARWKKTLGTFLMTNIPRCGALPIFGGLDWGMTRENVLLLKDDKGKPTYARYKPFTFSDGVYALGETKTGVSFTALVFDGGNGLKACSRELYPQTSRTAELAKTQLTIILGKGKPWTPQAVLTGHELVFSREWTPWNDILVRCTITKVEKSGIIVTDITYGKRDFVSHFEPMAESARNIDMQHEF